MTMEQQSISTPHRHDHDTTMARPSTGEPAGCMDITLPAKIHRAPSSTPNRYRRVEEPAATDIASKPEMPAGVAVFQILHKPKDGIGLSNTLRAPSYIPYPATP